MKIGGFYKVKLYTWFVYPSIELAYEIDIPWTNLHHHAPTVARIHMVSYMPVNDCFVLLEDGPLYRRILMHDGTVGWMLAAECGVRGDWDKDCFEDMTTE
jgi:hypothetical protein